jgi:RimJ/RimL family protein N-acetyltransferase
VPAFVEALRDPAVADGAYHGRIPAEPEAVRAYIGRNAERMAGGGGVLLGVWEWGADRPSGQTLLFNIDWGELTAEIGFWTAPWARRRGLSGCALHLTLALAFDHLGLERVFGLTGVENAAAQRSMERAGFQKEGILRGLERSADGRLDQVSYAILSTDPRP